MNDDTFDIDKNSNNAHSLCHFLTQNEKQMEQADKEWVKVMKLQEK